MAALQDDSSKHARMVTRARWTASPDAPLRTMFDNERTNVGIEQRTALFWSELVDREAMTLRGMLRFAAESGALARCVLHDGAVRHATIGSVGIDVVELFDRNGQHVLASLDRLRSVRLPGTGLAASDVEPSAATFHSCLVALADDRADVRLHLDGGHHEQGVVMTCGVDVVVLRTNERDLAYVPLHAISEAVVVLPPPVGNHRRSATASADSLRSG